MPVTDPAELADAIVSDLLGLPVHAVQTLAGGNVARAFRVETASRSVVIRLVRDIPDAFAADIAVGCLLTGTGVPVPELVGSGKREGWLYAVSAFAPGENSDHLTLDALELLLPDLVRMMTAIHRVDITGTTGSGAIGPDGNGRNASWRAHLTATFDDAPAGYWHDWTTRLAGSRFDRTLFDRGHAAMLGLLPSCPEQRWLVHGDFGFSNVLVEDGRITAVLDWSNARYGDFMWDVAWLWFFQPDAEVLEFLRHSVSPDGGPVPAFDERLACCALVIGLDGLRFYARADDAAAYDWTTERLLSVLAGLPPV